MIPGAQAWASGGDGPGVLVVHGFTGNPVAVRPLAEALADEGFRVQVPRLPGHGTSWRDLARTRYADWRVAVDREFERLTSVAGPSVIVGLSMGGTLALDVTAHRCRAAAQPAPAGVVTINAIVLDREDPLAALAPVVRWIVPVLPAEVAGVARNDIAKGGDEKAYPFIPTKAGYSLTRELPRVRDALADVQVPVLVAGSLEDHSVAPENADAIARLVGSADVERLVLERSYHLATMDHDAELLAERVAAFVRRVAS